MASSETQAIMDETIAVLVVDDDASIQSIVEETLSDGGFDPTVASSGEEAIALLNANKYRVLIIDIAFGRDHIRVLYITPGIMLGGYGSGTRVASARRRGVFSETKTPQ
jgi:DNA-binding NtrC family response regulator